MAGSIAPFTSLPGLSLMDEHGLELINDNSKRIVSIRINTSDFGRIKAIAKRLKVRDSDVLRFVLRMGLGEILTLCQSEPSPAALLKVFAAHEPALVRHFDLNAAQLDRLLNAGREAHPVSADDLELIIVASQSQRLLALRLHELLGVIVPVEDAIAFLGHHLLTRYGAATGDADA